MQSEEFCSSVCVCAHAGDTSVSHLCVHSLQCPWHQVCTPCVHRRTGCVCVCVHTWAGSVCARMCVPVGWQASLAPHQACSLGFGRAPLGNTSNPTRAGPHGKALTQQLVSIPLHLQRRPRNENPMGTLVGVNKYAIKIRKSKLWTGLFSCPLISFITEILLLNNISVNNLSSVFCSARVNNSIPGGGSPPAWLQGQQPCPAKGYSGSSSLTIPSSAGMKKETRTSRETTQHGVAQANASKVQLGLDPGTLAALLQQEGLPPSQHRALSARNSLKGHQKNPFGGCSLLIRYVSPMTSREECSGYSKFCRLLVPLPLLLVPSMPKSMLA